MQLQTAPVLLLFPPTVGENASADGQPKRFDFLAPQTADSVHSWIVRNLPPGEYPTIYRPFNYTKLATTITLLVGIVTVAILVYPYALPIVQNRNLWAALSLIMVLMFTSGHMFNHIRKVPYIMGNGKGGITYFAGGFSNQLGVETQIIAAICKLLPFKQSNSLLIPTRCRPVLCHNSTRAQSSTNQERKNTTNRGVDLVGCYVRGLQLSDQRVQDQEWGISVLVAAILEATHLLVTHIDLKSINCYVCSPLTALNPLNFPKSASLLLEVWYLFHNMSTVEHRTTPWQQAALKILHSLVE